MCTGVNLFTLETVSDGAIAVTTQKYLPMFFAWHSKRRGRTLLKIPISKNVLSLWMICFFFTLFWKDYCFSKQRPATTVSNFEATQVRAGHSSYLSQPPQPAVVYFFLAGVLFSIENAKCWPNLANFDQFWLFCREFTEFFGVLFIDLNNAAVY